MVSDSALLLLMSDTEPTIDAVEMGRLLALHPKSVLRLARLGRIPSLRLGRKTIRFRAAEVFQHIEASGKKKR